MPKISGGSSHRAEGAKTLLFFQSMGKKKENMNFKTLSKSSHASTAVTMKKIHKFTH